MNFDSSELRIKLCSVFAQSQHTFKDIFGANIVNDIYYLDPFKDLDPFKEFGYVFNESELFEKTSFKSFSQLALLRIFGKLIEHNTRLLKFTIILVERFSNENI
jgi:hypothetical protein